MFYEITGYGVSRDENIDNYFFRVAWYESGDGSGSQLSSPNDTEKSNSKSGEWVKFSQIIQAPVTAKSAKVRLVLTSKTNGKSAAAYFDDVVFQESVAPSLTPTATPTITPIPTPQPTQTLTPNNTPIPTKKPTPTSYPTQKYVSDILGIQNIASEDADIPGLPGSDVVKIGTPSGNTARPVVFSLLFIGTGTGLLAVALALQKTDVWKTHIDQQRHQK